MDGSSSAYGICTYCSPSYDILLPIADITMIVNRYPGKNLICDTYTLAVSLHKGMAGGPRREHSRASIIRRTQGARLLRAIEEDQ